MLNANKLSVALNLTQPDGVAVARRLALWADAVAENFAPGRDGEVGPRLRVARRARAPTW